MIKVVCTVENISKTDLNKEFEIYLQNVPVVGNYFKLCSLKEGGRHDSKMDQEFKVTSATQVVYVDEGTFKPKLEVYSVSLKKVN